MSMFRVARVEVVRCFPGVRSALRVVAREAVVVTGVGLRLGGLGS